MKLKKIWRAFKTSLQKKALGITGIGFRIVDLSRASGILGCTKKGKEIGLSPDHPIMDGLTEEEKLFFMEGVFAHELMHQLATDFDEMVHRTKYKLAYEKEIFHKIFNVIEDPAIENQAPRYFGGVLLEALYFSIRICYRAAGKINPKSRPFTQFFDALIHYGDGGLLKGTIADPQAKAIFYQALPYVDQAIEEPDPKKRLDLAEEVFRLSRPLWEEDAKNMQKMKKLLQSLSESMEQAGKQGSGSGSSDGPCGVPSGSGKNPRSDRKKKRRGATKQKTGSELSSKETEGASSKEKEGEGTKGSGHASGSEAEPSKSGMGGATSVDPYGSKETEGSSGASGGTSESASEESPETPEKTSGGRSADKDSEEESESGTETTGSSGSETEESEETGEAKTPSGGVGSGEDSEEDGEGTGEAETEEPTECKAKSSSSGYTKDIMHSKSGSGAAIDYSEEETEEPEETEWEEDEISEEEYDLTEHDIESIRREVKECERMSEEAERDVRNAGDELLDIPEMSISHPGVRCVNLKVSDASFLETEYQNLRSELAGGIMALTNQLKRIFQNDQEEKEYRQSGRVSVKRLRSGHMTSRVFQRRVSPENKSDIAMMLVVDVSGSMRGRKATVAKQTAIGIAEVCHNLHIPLKVMSFTADGYVNGQRWDVIHTHYVNWSDSQTERLKLLNIAAGGNNYDGYSIRYAGKLLKRRPESHKLMIVVSDGQPACNAYCGTSGITDTKAAIKDAGKTATVFGVAIDANKDILYNMYGAHFVDISQINELFEQLGNVIKKEIRSW